MSKAIRIHSHGGPEVMRWEDIELAPPAAGELRSGLMGFLILGGFFFLIWVAGFHVAAVALMLLFSLALARMRFVPAIVYTAAIVAALTGMGMLLSIHWPVGILRGAP